MSKAKRTEQQTKDHIAVLEYGLEERERELTTLHETMVETKRKELEKADFLAMRAHEHVKRVKAARALITELDDYTDACVVKEQAVNIVGILLESARRLSFEAWIRSTRQGPDPDDLFDDAKEKIAATETA
jgi:hypothetical protein